MKNGEGLPNGTNEATPLGAGVRRWMLGVTSLLAVAGKLVSAILHLIATFKR